MNAPKSKAELAAEADAKVRATQLVADLELDEHMAASQKFVIEIALMQWYHRGACAAIDDCRRIVDETMR